MNTSETIFKTLEDFFSATAVAISKEDMAILTKKLEISLIGNNTPVAEIAEVNDTTICVWHDKAKIGDRLYRVPIVSGSVVEANLREAKRLLATCAQIALTQNGNKYQDINELIDEVSAFVSDYKNTRLHGDNVAVYKFAYAMRQKLEKSREKGRGGWQECSQEELSRMLHEHVVKGDPVDVANFCMFLWNNGCGISPASQQGTVK